MPRKGKHVSAETKRRMSEGQKRRHAERQGKLIGDISGAIETFVPKKKRVQAPPLEEKTKCDAEPMLDCCEIILRESDQFFEIVKFQSQADDPEVEIDMQNRSRSCHDDESR